MWNAVENVEGMLCKYRECFRECLRECKGLTGNVRDFQGMFGCFTIFHGMPEPMLVF